MQELLVVMAILGCADTGSQCQTVQKVDAGFTTVEACNAASPMVLEKLTDLAYPVVIAQCSKIPAAPTVAEADSKARPTG